MSEIAALIINSTVSLYSYSIIQKGQKIRMKDGADGQVYNESGMLLQEEQQIRNGPIFEEEELEEMREEMEEEEVKALIDSEASFRTTFALTARYLGSPIDTIELEKIEMYRFEKE